MKKEIKPIVGVRFVKGEKGDVDVIVRYLSETPKDEIDRLNGLYTEWKLSTQIQYDKQGRRVE